MACQTDSIGLLLGASSGSSSKSPQFTDPFVLPSDASFPLDVRTALDLCLYLYYKVPLYAMASRRVVSHFITDIDFPDDQTDAEMESKLYDLLKDRLHIFKYLLALGDEWSVYGNGLLRMVTPFRRILVDYRNGYKEYEIDNFPDAVFSLEDMKYSVKDPSKPNKNETIKLEFRDIPIQDEKLVMLRLLDPRHVRLRRPHFGGPIQYIWRFEEWFKRDIRQGILYQVNATPKEILQVIKDGQDFLFNPGEVFHLANPSVSGISDQGWGLPPIIANYNLIHQYMVYNKIDEVIGQDYMMPFRVFSTGLNSSESISFLQQVSGAQWKSEINTMVKNRRNNMYSYHAFPYPINYDELGATGKQLSTKDIKEFEMQNLLDAVGYPAELFRGSMFVEQIPVAIRLFENQFRFLKDDLSACVTWVTNKYRAYLNKKQITAVLQTPAIADDLELRNIRMQLGAAGEISRAKALKGLGIDDPVAEVIERHKEDLQVEEGRMEKQEEFERRLMSGTVGDAVVNMQQQMMEEMGAGGVSQQAMPTDNMSPTHMQDQAREIAVKLLDIPHDGDRRRELDKIRASNPTLHALVKQHMEEIRSQGASIGRQEATQMMQ